MMASSASSSHLADHAGATAEAPGTARVLVERVAREAQREHHLHELGRVVLLGHVVDRVEAVGERPRAVAHGHAVAAQEELVARPIEAAEEVDVVDRVRRRRRRRRWPAPAARARSTARAPACGPRLPSAAGQCGCRMLPGRTSTSSMASWAPSLSSTRGVPGQQIDAHDQLGDALVHDEVDRPARLVVALPRVEADPAALLGQAHAHVERTGRSCRRRPPRPRYS